MINTSVEICKVKFKNPVITASGTFGFGAEFAKFFDLSKLGGICVKGLTLKPREGNAPPRIAETPSGVLNSVGLQNPGVMGFIKDELPRLLKIDTKIIANIAGDTVSEYKELASILSDTGTHMIELNISCPNVEKGGALFGGDPLMVERVTAAARGGTKKPLIVKLSPNVTDIREAARAAEAGGADAVSLVNTLIGMKIDIKTQKPFFKRGVGGLSGPAIKPVAVRMVWEAARAVSIPVIGMGGIMNGEDAVEFLLAGAALIAVGTANFKDPFASLRVLEGISEYMKENNIADISEIIGGVNTGK